MTMQSTLIPTAFETRPVNPFAAISDITADGWSVLWQNDLALLYVSTDTSDEYRAFFRNFPGLGDSPPPELGSVALRGVVMRRGPPTAATSAAAIIEACTGKPDINLVPAMPVDVEPGPRRSVCDAWEELSWRLQEEAWAADDADGLIG